MAKKENTELVKKIDKLERTIKKVDTFGSNVGGESPEEILHRIAQGHFACRVNGTASGGGTYSHPLDDYFNPFDQ
ncbi:hypothetical protein ACP4OV_023211 [Aristida adscensionis]